MKKLIFLLFLFLFLPFPVFSQEVIAPSDITCYTGETKYIEILIRNKQSFQDDFLISVFPQNLEGVKITPENYFVSLPPNSEKSIGIFFSVPYCIKEFSSTFSINVKSMRTNSITQKSVFLNIKGKVVCLTGLIIDKKEVNPEETVSLEISFTNPSEEDSPSLTLKTFVKDSSGNIVKIFEENIEKVGAKQTKKVLYTYYVRKYDKPGTYEVSVFLLDNLNREIDSIKGSFYVNPTYTNIPEKTSQLNILSSTVTIKVKNDGNAPTPPFYVSESLPAFASFFFQPEKKPDKIETVGNSVIYYWIVETIKPGGEITITYRISLLNVWLLSLAIIFLGYVGYRFAFTPIVVKKSSYVGKLEPERELTISIEVKNRSRHTLEDVKIRDFVPSILKLSEKFDTIKPKTKKTSGGIYLFWDFDSLKPREERILTYRVRPALEIAGVLNLPKAIMSYLDKKKMKKVSISKTISLKSTG
ncbi:MAG: hypothetical protein QXP77_00655 [Candidatus Aenigmatarchaeota archaeon]